MGALGTVLLAAIAAVQTVAALRDAELLAVEQRPCRVDDRVRLAAAAPTRRARLPRAATTAMALE